MSGPDAPRLRLAAARGTLGLELDAPFAMRPIVVSGLSLTFPNIRFPIDLSGGVTRFRHRRGALARLAIEAASSEVARWAAPRLRGILREGTPDIWLSPVEGGFAVGLADADAALAFDVMIVPSGDALVLVPERARGLGLRSAHPREGRREAGRERDEGLSLGAPPHALALRALAAAMGTHGVVEGGAVRISDAAAALLRALLPAAGARAPSTIGCVWDVARAEGDRLFLEVQIDVPAPALPDRLVRAHETLLLAAEADQAAYRGDPERARDAYLTALERAPRHPEISERLAWLDATLGDRAEAALSTLVDVTPAAFAGLLGAELLSAVGDAEGGRGALARAAPAEPFGPLAARMWMRAAALAESLRERLAALDEAVARAPALADARWARLEGRLDAADPLGALADAEHLEAAARGARARHEIALRAARAFLAAGFSTEAHRLFERALRYVPDDAEAVTGLARALAAQGARRRALDLFARALALTERTGAPTSAVAIELAQTLVEVAGDRPAAIARVRVVPASAPEAAEARLLEARWRAELGDLAGAGLAIGRLRDHVERTAATADPISTAALLAEAATLDERQRDDLAGAQRDLALAIRFAPKDARIAASFRRVARELARRTASPSPGVSAVSGPAMPPPPRRASAALRARAPSPLPPVPQPPPSVDLGVELPEVHPDSLDLRDDFAAPSRSRDFAPAPPHDLAPPSRSRDFADTGAREEIPSSRAARDFAASVREAVPSSRAAHDFADAPREPVPSSRFRGDFTSGAHGEPVPSSGPPRGSPDLAPAAHERSESLGPSLTPRQPLGGLPIHLSEDSLEGPLPLSRRDPLDEPSDLEVDLPTMRPEPYFGSAPPPAPSHPVPALAPPDDIEATQYAQDERPEDETAFQPPLDDETAFQPPPEDELPSDAAPPAGEAAAEEGDALAEDEALADRLASRLRADPRNRATVLALCDVLDRLGRDLELFALVSARIDEGDDDERRALLPVRRAVLSRLASRARTAGNNSEAELYEMMLSASE